MAQKQSTQVFDTPRFLEDVHAYRSRHNLSIVDVADLSGLSRRTMRDLYRGFTPGLRTVVSLANVCDLSIDKYRKYPEGEAA